MFRGMRIQKWQRFSLDLGRGNSYVDWKRLHGQPTTCPPRVYRSLSEYKTADLMGFQVPISKEAKPRHWASCHGIIGRY